MSSIPGLPADIVPPEDFASWPAAAQQSWIAKEQEILALRRQLQAPTSLPVEHEALEQQQGVPGMQDLKQEAAAVSDPGFEATASVHFEPDVAQKVQELPQEVQKHLHQRISEGRLQAEYFDPQNIDNLMSLGEKTAIEILDLFITKLESFRARGDVCHKPRALLQKLAITHPKAGMFSPAIDEEMKKLPPVVSRQIIFMVNKGLTSAEHFDISNIALLQQMAPQDGVAALESFSQKMKQFEARGEPIKNPRALLQNSIRAIQQQALGEPHGWEDPYAHHPGRPLPPPREHINRGDLAVPPPPPMRAPPHHVERPRAAAGDDLDNWIHDFTPEFQDFVFANLASGKFQREFFDNSNLQRLHEAGPEAAMIAIESFASKLDTMYTSGQKVKNPRAVLQNSIPPSRNGAVVRPGAEGDRFGIMEPQVAAYIKDQISRGVFLDEYFDMENIGHLAKLDPNSALQALGEFADKLNMYKSRNERVKNPRAVLHAEIRQVSTGGALSRPAGASRPPAEMRRDPPEYGRPAAPYDDRRHVPPPAARPRYDAPLERYAAARDYAPVVVRDSYPAPREYIPAPRGYASPPPTRYSPPPRVEYARDYPPRDYPPPRDYANPPAAREYARAPVRDYSNPPPARDYSNPPAARDYSNPPAARSTYAREPAYAERSPVDPYAGRGTAAPAAYPAAYAPYDAPKRTYEGGAVYGEHAPAKYPRYT